ncbi:glycosyltransferase family 4 protein [Salinicola endophyticus]|uniref:Glycosyltransferase family 4 protein n=1 Tax=Salinicola endophyticus TaxID=1949083 RepID=A0AB74U610_9GAMM
MTGKDFSDPSTIRMGHLVSLRNLGGVERYFTRFYTRHAPRNDHHVLLQTNDVHPLLEPAYTAYRPSRLHSIKGGRWHIPKFMPGTRKRYQLNMMRRLELDAVVVWNKIANHPLAFDGTIPLIHFERGSAWLAQDAPGLRGYLTRLNGVLCNSYAGLRMLQLKWQLDEHIPHQVLQNAISLPTRIADHPGDRFRLGFAGRMTGLKAPMVALETFAELKQRCPEAELWIAGNGPLEPVLKHWTSKWGLEESVRFLGLVDDMPQFYASLDAFICPSWREPFGNVVQEALAHGVPTLVGNVDGLPELVRHDVNGAVLSPSRSRQSLAHYDPRCAEGPNDVYDPTTDSLADAGILEPAEAAAVLESWAHAPSLRKRMALAAREQVEQEFDLDRYGETLVDFVRQVARKTSS